MIAALLFTWLQEVDFYIDLHKTAVDCIPLGEGKSWIDVGCGPGLISRLAASNKFDVTGTDRDPCMIRIARCLAKRHGSNAKFETGDFASLSGRKADVVSAVSLPAVVPDKTDALSTLWFCVEKEDASSLLEQLY